MLMGDARAQADIGIKHHKIAGIGKGGNPDVMDGITPGMIVGVNTEVIGGEKLIVTAGAMDAHGEFRARVVPTQPVATALRPSSRIASLNASRYPRSTLHLPSDLRRGSRQWYRMPCFLRQCSSSMDTDLI